MFRIFLAFLIFAKFPVKSLAPDHILCFLKFLASNKVSQSGIANYISAVKTKLSMYDLSVGSFSDPRLRYFSRSLSRNAYLRVSLKTLIDILKLTRMI